MADLVILKKGLLSLGLALSMEVEGGKIMKRYAIQIVEAIFLAQLKYAMNWGLKPSSLIGVVGYAN